MTNQSFEDQFELAKRAAHQSGISGTAYIDFDPAGGFLRIKLEVTPPESQSLLISNFASALAQGCQAFGLRVKKHQRDSKEAGGKK